jgi:hypothetical protein
LTISDIDECSEGNISCHPNATCINTQGSYNCQCKDGYKGFGKRNCTGVMLFLKQNNFFFLKWYGMVWYGLGWYSIVWYV